MNARDSVVSGLHAMPATDAIRAVAAVATVRSSEPGPLRTRWNELAAIATAPSPDRTMVAVLANLDEMDRALVSTLVAVLTTPNLAGIRDELRSGSIGLTVEHGIVTLAPASVQNPPCHNVHADILQAVCQQTGVTREQLMGRARGADHICFGRMICMVLYRELTHCSLSDASTAWGRNEHGTALNAERILANRCSTCADDRALVNRIRRSLRMAPWQPSEALVGQGVGA
jgi:hypothetical protein